MASPKKKKRKRTQREADDLDAQYRIWFTDLLAAWTTCESNLRLILAELIYTDQWTADLIMYSILSTRARVDMINRMAIMALGDKRKLRHLQKLLREFKAVTQLRNRLAHSVYTFRASSNGGDVGVIESGTFVNFIKSSFDGENMYEEFVIDKDLFNQMRQMTTRAYSLSHRFVRFADSFRTVNPPKPPHAIPPSQLWRLHKAKASRPDPKKE